MLRTVTFAPGEYYHIYNRGNHKHDIFQDRGDYLRLLFLILSLQGQEPIYKISRYCSEWRKQCSKDYFTCPPLEEDLKKSILTHPLVTVVAFALMPNHFHVLLQEVKDAGVSRFMQRLLNAYTKYSNTKYENVGHLFQGPFKAVHVRTNEQLTYLSAYIHRNPRDLQQWKGQEISYPWSSYQDYAAKNRWALFLNPDIILNQFSSGRDYQRFVEASGAKEKQKNSLDGLMLD